MQVAIFQNFCARLKSEVFESVVGGSAWAALKGQCAELIPDLQKRMCVIMAEAISGELATLMVGHSEKKAA